MPYSGLCSLAAETGRRRFPPLASQPLPGAAGGLCSRHIQSS